MDADRWRLVSRVFGEAMELPADQRASHLKRVCEGDAALRAEVESLLEAAKQGAFLDQPAIAADTRTLEGLEKGKAHIALPSGKKFGPYLILRRLGEGGMGVVYQATDTRLGRPVALKLISSPDASEQHRLRFAREARAASALNHPNIATIYEFDRLGETDYLAMEYVDGIPLQEILTEKKTALFRLLEYARQTALAVSAAHAAGIVHRDLKPGNILITRDGTAKVLDFGLAKMSLQEGSDETQTILTRAGAMMGTPPYMSPEQVAGDLVDYRSDLFSFGTILYEMTCGVRPFDAPNPHSTLHLIATAEPRPVKERNASAPIRLTALIERCLKKKREERPQSMKEVEEELAKILAPADEVAPARTPSRRRMMAGIGVVAIATGAGGYWLLRPPAMASVSCFVEVRGQDGQAHPASFRDTFDSGTRFRLGAEADQPGNLYIGSGETVLTGGALPPRQAVRTEWLVIEGPPGTDKVWFVWSRHPLETSAIRGILGQLQVASPDVNGRTVIGGSGEIRGAQTEIRHR